MVPANSASFSHCYPDYPPVRQQLSVVLRMNHFAFPSKALELYKPSLNLKILPTQFAIINILCTVRFFRHCSCLGFAYILSIWYDIRGRVCFVFFFLWGDPERVPIRLHIKQYMQA